MPLVDTLLRMAEEPRLYVPKWSEDILGEVERNLVSALNLTPAQSAHRVEQMKAAFPSALAHPSYKRLIAGMPTEIHPKDRHVVAAALRSNCELIVTYNKKAFPQAALSELGITVLGPSTFLISLFDLEPAVATRKLHEQAEAIGIRFDDLLGRMNTAVPAFASYLREVYASPLAPVSVSKLPPPRKSE
jgi:hypothetical protein